MPDEVDFKKSGELVPADDRPLPHYAADLKRWLLEKKKSGEIGASGVYEVKVLHDTWCPELKDGSGCVCKPDFVLESPAGGVNCDG